MYGLILPSGNDAATALAEYFHKVLHDHKKNEASLMEENNKHA